MAHGLGIAYLLIEIKGNNYAYAGRVSYEMGRSEKALKNVSTGLINKAAIMLLSFATKTIFIRLLGAEYNGVHSLYTNILSVLALAELGLGNVLMFYLYSAIEQKDTKRISALINEFRVIYNKIIIFILAVGLALVPFLKYLISSELDSNKLLLYYILYLINSVASYFVVYRTMLLRADQKEYIVNNCNTIATITMYCLQLIYLFSFRDFLGYLLIQVLCTISNNLIQNHIALNKYPYLRENYSLRIKDEEKKDIFKNVKATFIFKVSDTILDQTDNIIISVMFGTIVVGFYANYYLIIAYLVQIASIFVSGLIASFGNLYASGNDERSYEMIKCFLLFFSFFATICISCYASVVQDFIPIWVGSQYVMSFDLVVAVLFVFYIRMVTNTVWMCRSTMGLFKEVQYVNLAAAVMNVILSILLGKLFCVSGVIFATGVSRLVTSFWYEAIMVFRKIHKKPSDYFVTQIKHLTTSIVIVFASFYINSLFSTNGLLIIALKIFICLSATILLESLFYHNTAEYRVLLNRLLRLVPLKH